MSSIEYGSIIKIDNLEFQGHCTTRFPVCFSAFWMSKYSSRSRWVKQHKQLSELHSTHTHTHTPASGEWCSRWARESVCDSHQRCPPLQCSPIQPRGGMSGCYSPITSCNSVVPIICGCWPLLDKAMSTCDNSSQILIVFQTWVVSNFIVC